ncbi:DUF4843 domain-containing protein [Butyricimonas virosa]|jgi:hypothetical protein|uniref:DUF4843 domain-containing protein n=1 Tax=Butyricimonas virosa TaxID=544645 RepID=UPI0022E399AD|nr:DUF4843 domain-containing protein [Butyricimonas virosa]MDY5533696.1 DUF4843 domain-containing protein [Butyricimonas virosa]
MKLRIILFALISFPFLWSCDKKEIPVFASDDAGIYFQRLTNAVYGSTTEYYGDSTDFSFAGTNAYYTSHVLYAPVLTMGKVVDYDRPFKVVVDMEETTAVEGKDFEIELDSLVIKAGTSKAEVPVRIIRTETLLEKTLKIVLRLQENEHFKCYLETYKNTNLYTAKGEQISGVRYVFTFNEMYTQPNFWKNYAEKDYFGEWTAKKYQVVNQVCGLTPIDWRYANYYGYKMQSARLPFFARTVRIYLQEQADAGNPVTDSDGKYMQLAPNYEVDYSDYQ